VNRRAPRHERAAGWRSTPDHRKGRFDRKEGGQHHQGQQHRALHWREEKPRQGEVSEMQWVRDRLGGSSIQYFSAMVCVDVTSASRVTDFSPTPTSVRRSHGSQAGAAKVGSGR
jgi:hypothetical protein